MTADTLLYLDGVSVSFDGFKALTTLSLFLLGACPGNAGVSDHDGLALR